MVIAKSGLKHLIQKIKAKSKSKSFGLGREVDLLVVFVSQLVSQTRSQWCK